MRSSNPLLIVDDNNSILYTCRRAPRFQDDGKASYLVWDLVPVAIYDYVDPDYSDNRGWLQDTAGMINVDSESIVQYVITESFENALAEFGYSFIDVSNIYIKEYGEERATLQDAKIAADNAIDLW
jgi:hypothetical protein